MTKEQIQSQIEALIRKAETGEQWAEICRLAAALPQIEKTERDWTIIGAWRAAVSHNSKGKTE